MDKQDANVDSPSHATSDEFAAYYAVLMMLIKKAEAS
jgi:hypothetical protein